MVRTPSQEASTAMAPMTTTMNALSASARSTPKSPPSAPWRTTRTQSTIASASIAALVPTAVQAAQGLHRAAAQTRAPMAGRTRMSTTSISRATPTARRGRSRRTRGADAGPAP